MQLRPGTIRKSVFAFSLFAVLVIASARVAIATGWPPFTRNDNATAPRGGEVTVLNNGLASVLSNDFDFERDPMTAVLAFGPQYGTLVLNQDGTFRYQHNGNSANVDAFYYRAFDGTGFSRVTTVRINIIEPPNLPPYVTGNPGSQEAIENKAFSLALAGYFDDPDPDDELEFSAFGLPGGGNLRIDDETGVLTGTPRSRDVRDAPYNVTIRATDEGGLSASLVFQLTILADDRADLEVTAASAVNPVTVGEAVDWTVNVENLGPGDLEDGELVVQWVTGGTSLSLTAPQDCTVSGNNSREPSIRCDISGQVARTTRSFDVAASQNGDGDQSLIAVALSDDPSLENNATVQGAQVVRAFSEGPAQMLNSEGVRVAVGDLDGDNLVDLVVTDDQTRVFYNTGNRSFESSGKSLGNGSGGAAVAILDWNGDSNADIAVGGLTNLAGRVYLGDGSGNFADAVDLRLQSNSGVVAIAAADFAQDGYHDVVLTGTSGSVLARSTGGSGFSETGLPAGPGMDVSTGDLDNDSWLDIVIVESGDRSVRLLRNSGNGSRLRRGSVASANAVDVSGDGRADLLLAIDGADLEAPESLVLVARSDGSFPAGDTIGASPLSRMLAGDVDGDSRIDIVTINDAGVHQLYRGLSGGGFTLDAEQIVSDGMKHGVLVDFNSDASLDLILAGEFAGVIEVHANNGIGKLGMGDRIAPVVTLLGESSMNLAAGEAYIEPGATAADDIDGDVSASVVISGNVNTTVVGTYQVSYSAADRAGNIGTAVRNIQVGVNQGTGGSGGGALSPLIVVILLASLLLAGRLPRVIVRRSRVHND